MWLQPVGHQSLQSVQRLSPDPPSFVKQEAVTTPQLMNGHVLDTLLPHIFINRRSMLRRVMSISLLHDFLTFISKFCIVTYRMAMYIFMQRHMNTIIFFQATSSLPLSSYSILYCYPSPEMIFNDAISMNLYYQRCSHIFQEIRENFPFILAHLLLVLS